MNFITWTLAMILAFSLSVMNVGDGLKKKELEIKITDQWYVQKGDKDEYKNTEYDDSKWITIKVPEPWENNENFKDYDGIGWYRVSVFIPESWSSEGGIMFNLGCIDDNDITYFNGNEIGQTNGWETVRNYYISPSLIHYGKKNVIAIRVSDTGGGGGIYKGELKLVTGIPFVFDIKDF